MAERTVTLPARDEMLRRLVGVNNSSHAQQKLYPILLEGAGRKLVAQDVVMWMALAIHDYTEGLPPVMSNLLYAMVPHYVDALVDDKEVAAKAKEFLKEALASPG